MAPIGSQDAPRCAVWSHEQVTDNEIGIAFDLAVMEEDVFVGIETFPGPWWC